MGPVLDMLRRSDLVTTIILILLAFFSAGSWFIIVNRFFYLTAVRRMHHNFVGRFKLLGKIDDMQDLDEKLLGSPMAVLASSGQEEFRRILEDAKAHKKGVTDWSFYLQNQLMMAQDKIATEIGRLARKQDWGLYLLAVISSTAPFLGLFGTVWGIMNSFYAIGDQGSASLPVVAPGIAAALITTIIGLAVAIPAVVFYNVFNHKVQRIEDEMDEFGDHLYFRIKQELFQLLFGSQKTAPASSVSQAPPSATSGDAAAYTKVPGARE